MSDRSAHRDGGGPDLQAFRAAVGDDLETLALLHDREPDAATLGALSEIGFPLNLGLRLDQGRAGEIASAMARVVASLPAEPDAALLDELAADYAQIYLTHAIRAAPMESVWIDKEGLVRQGPMFAVRDHYRRHGLEVRDWSMRPDDHLVTELQFLAHLMTRVDGEAALAEAAHFLDEHPLRWVDQFATRVAKRCASEYFAGLALTTSAYLEQLREVLAELTGIARPAAEEIAQRALRAEDIEELELPTSGPLTGPTW